jgi:hypothetical protein
MISLLLLTLCDQVRAQSDRVIADAGYRAPTAVTVAPGQIITFFLPGIGTAVTQRIGASVLPLPTTLGAISGVIRQSADPTQIAAPIIEVRPVSNCTPVALFASPCSGMTALSVQIPLEIAVNVPGSLAPPVISRLVLSENGSPAASIDLSPVPDNVHVLRACDLLVSSNDALCTSIVTHADGTLVSRQKPAFQGEIVVAYALGLGSTAPRVASGQATPAPATTVAQFALSFDFRPNAPAIRPISGLGISESPFPAPPLFAGLVSGLVSLYQINFAIPQIPTGLPSCGGQVSSNLTVTISGPASFDGASLCVEPNGVPPVTP